MRQHNGYVLSCQGWNQPNWNQSNWNQSNWNQRCQPPQQQYGNPTQNGQANLIYAPTALDKFGFIGMLSSNSLTCLNSSDPTNKNLKIFFIDSGANRFCVIDESMMSDIQVLNPPVIISF